MLLVSAIRDTALRWQIWVFRRRHQTPSLTGLRWKLTARHPEIRGRRFMDPPTLAAGAFLLMRLHIR
jgi:hypothetical protein